MNHFKLCKQKRWCELKLMIPAAFTCRTYRGFSVSRSTQNNTLPPSPHFLVEYWSTARFFIQLSSLFQPVASLMLLTLLSSALSNIQTSGLCVLPGTNFQASPLLAPVLL